MCPEALGVRALLLRDQFNNDVVFTMVAGRCPSPHAKTRLVAPRGLVLASPCGVQRWAHQPARRGRASRVFARGLGQGPATIAKTTSLLSRAMIEPKIHRSAVVARCAVTAGSLPSLRSDPRYGR